MRMSRLVAPTLREDPAEAEVPSHKLMLRAGMIRKLAAGIYNLLPLGQLTISKVAQIIREEMLAAGAQEVFLPTLLPKELWDESGRWGVYGKELFRINDRHEREFCLGPTHEEIITTLVRDAVNSYKQLPVNLFQIQSKFRDEIRPRFGIMRGREFMMKDAYSFHASKKSLDKEYENMRATYCRIFGRMGLKYKVVKADSGLMGGNYSEEFMVLAETGEEEIAPGVRGIEVGHIFKLGTKYSEKMNAIFLDEKNQEKPFIMGCYGIGVGRTAAAAIEQNNDKDGIIWPLAIAPYKIAIVPVNSSVKEQYEVAEKIYSEFKADALLDDRDQRMGVKLKDIDLIGIPIKVIIGPKGLKENKVELKRRSSGETKLVAIDKISAELTKIIKGDN
ncbi:proline--tRNA ligase [Candidatus Margulisiibacteriota bacterium]